MRRRGPTPTLAARSSRREQREAAEAEAAQLVRGQEANGLLASINRSLQNINAAGGALTAEVQERLEEWVERTADKMVD